MSFRLMDHVESQRLAALPPTSDLIRTQGEVPSGYRLVDRSVDLGRIDLNAVAAALLTWQIHSRAGLAVAASSTPLTLGSLVLLSLGWGSISIAAPCQVIVAERGDDHASFTYATLVGHPEREIETFTLTRKTHGHVIFTIRALSHPATRLAKLGGPITTHVQNRITARYLAAAQKVAFTT